MDLSLPAGCAASPPADFQALFDAHAALVHRVAQRLTGSAALADDVTQEVFLLAWRRRRELTHTDGIRTWLYRATLNVVRQGFRADRRYRAAVERCAAQPSPPDGGGPEAHLTRAERGARIRACVARLSPKLREVFILSELEDLEGAQIAAILDIPLNTVWSRRRLAQESFREEWGRAPEEKP